MLKTLVEVLKVAQKNKYAVIAPDFFNLEFACDLMDCGEEYQAPLIMSYYEGGKNTFELHPLSKSMRIIREEFAASKIPIVLHLDHAFSLEIIHQYLDLGFTSVMMDASSQPFEKNVEVTCKTVELAKPYGASVEAELGHVGGGGDASNHNVLTDSEEAFQFVKQTGVDALAVSVGTQHGIYKQTDGGLNFDILQKISAKVQVPLVLHGGSGTNYAQLKKAVSLGICKLNVFTELFNVYQQASCARIPKDGDDFYTVKMDRRKALFDRLHTFLELSGSIGKADDFSAL